MRGSVDAFQRLEPVDVALEAGNDLVFFFAVLDQVLLVPLDRVFGLVDGVDEIIMHRDRRVELFKAQARVTELYLRNQRLRMDQMRSEAGQYLPYSDAPGAAPIPDDLVADMRDTQATIERHEQNLDRYRQQEQQIIDEFDRNIERFRALTAPD